ncbi:MAG: ABC transporter ATP-binding protein [Cytophagaceae bacterium]|jgi:lipopolysaccharide transport system ATP-binding protein|nr:ABC transporter ATP-binding protein [Cytophagaceae bacterium]
MEPILEVSNLSKTYSIYSAEEMNQTFRESLIRFFQKKRFRERIDVLKNVTFKIEAGESVAIIGKNGAGKSTLLKILSKITPPTKGEIICRGKVASLLEVGTGFHSELTGRENIYLNGSILGLSKYEINKHFDAIVDFSGIHKFIETPIKHYSSGMQLRLAFAVAAHLEPEILIIDEVLAVGDSEFQKKCIGKMDEVSRSGRTILFVSHNLDVISSLCSRAIVLEKGEIKYDGDITSAIGFYNSSNSVTSGYVSGLKNKSVYIQKIYLKQIDKSFYYTRDTVEICFEIFNEVPEMRFDLFVLLLNEKKQRICAFEYQNIQSNVQLNIESDFLVRGKYSVTAFLNIPQQAKLDEVEDTCTFEVIDSGSDMQKHGSFNYGNVFGKGNWQLL